ncbi:MAG: hypothetical protein LBU53_08000 [Zoogloeaceae bacterium]|nr:hypothetical protein [Zoogloeaceae bacterium]
MNYDKTKSDDHEKAIIQARRQNLTIAEKLYIERQEKALGREPVEQQKEPGMNPQKLAGIRAGIEKAIDEKVKKNPAGKSSTPRKLKGKDEPDLER